MKVPCRSCGGTGTDERRTASHLPCQECGGRQDLCAIEARWKSNHLDPAEEQILALVAEVRRLRRVEVGCRRWGEENNGEIYGDD